MAKAKKPITELPVVKSKKDSFTFLENSPEKLSTEELKGIEDNDEFESKKIDIFNRLNIGKIFG